MEAPSAAFPLTWHRVLELEKGGIAFASLTHSAGISSTGDAALDRLLPLPEWFDVPAGTARAINSAKDRARRVVALGTTVVRAIESSIHLGRVVPRSGVTRLKIGTDHPPKVVDGLITGMHEEGTSHVQLMRAFCDESLVERAYVEAEELGYRGHEYGDLSLLM